MVIDIKMCRFDNVPWGFRLVGGSDFEFPLTVVKVAEGSIADEAGLRAGDVIVRINDTATSPLTHDEVNHIIRHCGNVFYLGIYRENKESSSSPAFKQFPIIGRGGENRETPDSYVDMGSTCKSPMSVRFSEEREYLPELIDRPCSVLSENTEIKLVEEEIAAVLSGESEVLKEHQVMGILPKPGVCMSSDVLRTLNEEAVKTKAEKDKENRKWTTFLQKPNRPIPKSKQQLEAERRVANAYKVKIVKSKPRDPNEKKEEEKKNYELSKSNGIESKDSNSTEVNHEKAEEESKKETQEELKKEEEPPTPTDSEVPNLEEIPRQETDSSNSTDTVILVGENKDIATEKEMTSAQQEVEKEDTKSTSSNSDNVDEKDPHQSAVNVVAKTEEELALERQLADVQRQLCALSNLPSTIQSTLDAVTKQLAEILPAFKLQQAQPPPSSSVENAPRSLQLEQIDESNESAKDETNGDPVNEEQENKGNEDIGKNSEVENLKKADFRENYEELKCQTAMDTANDKEVADFSAMEGKDEKQQKSEERQNLKKEKKFEVIEELEEQLVRRHHPKRSRRAFGPLTPSSERPLVLPGGRRWYRPKDAYNDEFIAEVLSSQAELITGHTLGSTYESPYLGYDSRVNFMKYQKPEKKIDLNRSEVYKIIHHLDRQPVRGIEVRAPLVPAASDIRKAVQS